MKKAINFSMLVPGLIAGFAGIITMAIIVLVLFVYDRFISEDKIMSKNIEL